MVKIQELASSPVTKELLYFLKGKIDEIQISFEISKFLKLAKLRYNIREYISAADIDKILRVGNEFKAILEFKNVTESRVKLFYSQDKTLRLLSKKLQIPVIYIIKRNRDYYFIKQHSEVYNFVKGSRGYDAYLDLNKHEPLSENDLIYYLADILQGEPELRK